MDDDGGCGGDEGCCLVCTDEGAYVDTIGHITRNSVLQWGEMPTSVGTLTACYSGERCPPRSVR